MVHPGIDRVVTVQMIEHDGLAPSSQSVSGDSDPPAPGRPHETTGTGCDGEMVRAGRIDRSTDRPEKPVGFRRKWDEQLLPGLELAGTREMVGSRQDVDLDSVRRGDSPERFTRTDAIGGSVQRGECPRGRVQRLTNRSRRTTRTNPTTQNPRNLQPAPAVISGGPGRHRGGPLRLTLCFCGHSVPLWCHASGAGSGNRRSYPSRRR